MKYTKLTFVKLWLLTFTLSCMILWTSSFQILSGSFIFSAIIFLNKILPLK